MIFPVSDKPSLSPSCGNLGLDKDGKMRLMLGWIRRVYLSALKGLSRLGVAHPLHIEAYTTMYASVALL